MTLPPIAERELRLAARRAGTYWGRAGAGLGAAFLVWWVMLSRDFLSPSAQAGRNAFAVLAIAGAVTTVGGALQLASATFAREKREGTLGLLLLTAQRPLGLVLGKLAASACGPFYQALAGLPVLALPLLVGGVSFVDFARLALALGGVLFLAAGLGLYVSLRCWEEKRAAGLANLLFWLVAGLGPLAGLLWQWRAGSGPLPSFLLATSPGYAVWQAALCLPRSWQFWWSLLVTLGLGGFCLWRACRILPYCWRERPAPLGQRLKQLVFRQTPARDSAAAARGRERLEVNPVFWLSLRDSRPVGWQSSILILGLAVAVVLWMAFSGKDWLHPAVVLVTCFVVNAVLKNGVARSAAEGLSTDRDDGAVELLLSTTQRVEDVVRGKWLALRRVFGRLAIATLAAEAAWMALACVFGNALESPLARLLFGAGCLAVLGVMVADLWAVGWVGLWSGVSERSAALAATNVQGLVLFLPWVAAAALCVPLLFAGSAAGLTAGACGWAASSLLADRWFGARARRRLFADLPLWALRRAEGDLEHYDSWRRLGRALGLRWRRWDAPRA